MEADQLSAGDYERLAAFRFALRRFSSFSSAAAHDAGLTTNQHQALLAIKGHGSAAMTVGILAEQMMVAPHTAAELVGRLEAADLVCKAQDTNDRRRTIIRLTPRAEDILRSLTLVHLREVQLLAPKLMTIFEDLGALLV